MQGCFFKLLLCYLTLFVDSKLSRELTKRVPQLEHTHRILTKGYKSSDEIVVIGMRQRLPAAFQSMCVLRWPQVEHRGRIRLKEADGASGIAMLQLYHKTAEQSAILDTLPYPQVSLLCSS
jgi:hypothetical protein